MTPEVQKALVKGAVAMGKRAYDGYTSRSNKKQKTSSSGTTAGGDLGIKTTASGRAQKKNLNQAWKVLKANTETAIYYMYYVNRFQAIATQPGYVPLKQGYVGATLNQGVVTQPLHLISLTAAPNAFGGTIIQPVALHILQYTDPGAAGTVQWQKNGQWLYANTPGSTASPNSVPGAIDTLKAVSIKLALHGTTTRPTKYLVQMVQLRKNYLHPEFMELNTLAGGDAADARGFYDELTRPYTYSPTGFFDSKHRKDIKVLKSWSQVIQPRIATDNYETTSSAGANGAFPHTQLLNIYHKFNRTQRYDWSDQVTTAEPVGNSDPGIPSVQGDNRNDTIWGARIYLMIRAINCIPTVSDAFDVTAQTSYDVTVRTYHQSLG